MPAAPRRFTDEIISDEMAAVLRAKTPAERFRIACGMWDFARQLIERSSRRKHPEWTDADLKAHVIRRMSHGDV
jgi:hypothetical protein